jgi:hypothetical protein
MKSVYDTIANGKWQIQKEKNSRKNTDFIASASMKWGRWSLKSLLLSMNHGFSAFIDNVWEMGACIAMLTKAVVMPITVEAPLMQPVSLFREQMGAPSVEKGAPIMLITAYVKSAL